MFGGFTCEPWTSGPGTCVRVCVSVCTHVCVSSGHKPDPRAFLFTLTNAAGLPPAKVKATKEADCAVRHDGLSLASFGLHDLDIEPNTHTKAKSFACWGDEDSAYPLPPGAVMWWHVVVFCLLFTVLYTKCSLLPPHLFIPTCTHPPSYQAPMTNCSSSVLRSATSRWRRWRFIG